MTIHINLPPETEAELRERAAAVGKDLASFVREAVEEKLAEPGEGAEGTGRASLTADQWIAELRAWAASHRRLNHFVDDSRESIYAGRCEWGERHLKG